MEEHYAVNELYSWFRENQDYFIDHNIEITYSDKGRDSASVGVNGSEYLIDIVAWDNASCLDIAVMVVSSGETKYLHTGSCISKREFIKNINASLDWYKNQIGNT